MAGYRDPATLPIAGHAIAHEGAAFTAEGEYARADRSWIGTAGQGYAKCECGAMSPEIGGRKYRREWHRQHKAEVREQEEGR